METAVIQMGFFFQQPHIQDKSLLDRLLQAS